MTGFLVLPLISGWIVYQGRVHDFFREGGQKEEMVSVSTLNKTKQNCHGGWVTLNAQPIWVTLKLVEEKMIAWQG